MARNKTPQIFLETSAVIRFFTRDDEHKFSQVVQLFTEIEAGRMRAVTSDIVILEILFVLHKLYGFSRKEISSAITKFIELRSLVIVETVNTKVAFSRWQLSNLPYGDCCIATQIPAGAQVATFDKDFTKIPDLVLYTWE